MFDYFDDLRIINNLSNKVYIYVCNLKLIELLIIFVFFNLDLYLIE